MLQNLSYLALDASAFALTPGREARRANSVLQIPMRQRRHNKEDKRKDGKMFGKETGADDVVPEAWQTARSKAFVREAPTFSFLAIPRAHRGSEPTHAHNTQTHTHTQTHTDTHTHTHVPVRRGAEDDAYQSVSLSLLPSPFLSRSLGLVPQGERGRRGGRREERGKGRGRRRGKGGDEGREERREGGREGGREEEEE